MRKGSATLVSQTTVRRDKSDKVGAPTVERRIPEEAEQVANLGVIEDVVAGFSELERLFGNQVEEYTLASYKNLGKLFTLAVEFSRDEQIRAALAQKSKLKRRKNTTEELFVVNAALRCAKRKAPTSTMSDWAMVIRALKISNVPPNAAAAAHWLSTPAAVREDGIMLSGYDKAFAVLDCATKDKPEDSAALAREEKRAAKKEEQWANYIKPKLDAPLGEMMLDAGLKGVDAGYTLGLVHIKGGRATLVDMCVTDEIEVREIAIKKS